MKKYRWGLKIKNQPVAATPLVSEAIEWQPPINEPQISVPSLYQAGPPINHPAFPEGVDADMLIDSTSEGFEIIPESELDPSYPSPRAIILQYPGRCRECGTDLNIGQDARWYGRGVLYGVSCHTDNRTEKPITPRRRRSYGSIMLKSEQGAEGNYRIRYTTPARERMTETIYGTREDAEEALRKHELEGRQQRVHIWEDIKQRMGEHDTIQGGDNMPINKLVCPDCSRTFQTGQGRARHTGLAHPITPEDSRKIIDLSMQGWSIKDIGINLARSTKRITRVLEDGQIQGPPVNPNISGDYRGMRSPGSRSIAAGYPVAESDDHRGEHGWHYNSDSEGENPPTDMEGVSQEADGESPMRRFVRAFEDRILELRAEIALLQQSEIDSLQQIDNLQHLIETLRSSNHNAEPVDNVIAGSSIFRGVKPAKLEVVKGFDVRNPVTEGIGQREGESV